MVMELEVGMDLRMEMILVDGGGGRVMMVVIDLSGYSGGGLRKMVELVVGGRRWRRRWKERCQN